MGVRNEMIGENRGICRRATKEPELVGVWKEQISIPVRKNGNSSKEARNEDNLP